MRAVILTNEKPSFPVPEEQEHKIGADEQRLSAPDKCLLCFMHFNLVVRESEPTQHLADVGLDVDVLKVLEGVSVVQPESGVQSDGHPDAIAIPGQLTYLALLTRVGVK